MTDSPQRPLPPVARSRTYRAATSGGPPPARWVLATTILSSSLAFVDSSVINVALPALGSSLHADAPSLQWLVNAYLLPLSALLLLGGGAGDHFGRRRVLMLGIALFALASLGCALASNLSLLLVSRLVQGIGAAFLMPNSLAVLGQTFAGPAKGRAIGIWAASGAAMAAVGPVLGGWLVDIGNWRAIFLINLPLAAAAIVLAWLFIADDPPRERLRLDAAGGLLATVGLGGIAWALTIGSSPIGWTPRAAAVGIAAGIVFAGFIRLEKRRGEQAMMPLSLFGSAAFVGLTLFTLLLYGALGALFVLIPYVLISSAGYSAVAAGAALLPFPLMLSFISPAAGSWAGRIGPRLPLGIGACIVAAGFLLGLDIDANAGYWRQVLPMLLVMAVGMSCAVAPLTTAVLATVDAHHAGSASGFNSAVARTGGLLGTALLGAVLSAQGPALMRSFHAAMICGAAACAVASACAFGLMRPKGSAASAAAVRELS